MNSFAIITDSCCDLTQEEYEKLSVSVTRLRVNFGGQESADRNDESLKAFYDGLRRGENASTAAVNPEQWRAAMEPALAAGQDALVLTFSSGLSATCQGARLAAQELQEEYPQRKILVVDTLCASMGQGLLLWYACKLRQEGKDLEQVHTWCEENKLHLCHWFTVDDLYFLKRGGRISGATALVGTMLNIKPVLHVDDEGHLVSVSKARGRKAAIGELVKKARELGESFDNEVMFISHGDCLEDARYLAEKLKESCGVKEVYINYVGAVIGSHAGPGTLALFFLGKHR